MAREAAVLLILSLLIIQVHNAPEDQQVTPSDSGPLVPPPAPGPKVPPPAQSPAGSASEVAPQQDESSNSKCKDAFDNFENAISNMLDTEHERGVVYIMEETFAVVKGLINDRCGLALIDTITSPKFLVRSTNLIQRILMFPLSFAKMHSLAITGAILSTIEHTLGSIKDYIISTVTEALDGLLAYIKKWIFQFIDAVLNSAIQAFSLIAQKVVEGMLTIFLPNFKDLAAKFGSNVEEILGGLSTFSSALSNPTSLLTGSLLGGAGSGAASMLGTLGNYWSSGSQAPVPAGGPAAPVETAGGPADPAGTPAASKPIGIGWMG